MKKQRAVRSILICFVFIFAVALQSHVVSAKSETKKNVTINIGQKKKIKIKTAKIKKLKVKSSKKSVAIVKIVGKKKIKITGKKAGKVTITVKMTTKTGKVKTIKYKVTVKKKKESKKTISNNNNTPTKSSDNQTNSSVVTPKYSYALQIMNSKDKHLYNNSKVVIYVKTNNPNPLTFRADCGTKRLVKCEDESGVFYTTEDEFHEIISPNAYDDVHYTNSNSAVKGGYLYTYEWDTSGKKNFTIQEKVGEVWVTATKMEINLLDKEKAENEWLYSVMNAVTNSGMTNKEKMNKLEQYVLNHFKYDRNNQQGEIYLLADVGVYWERKHIDCWDSTNIMCLFAKKLGLENKWTYAGYAQHYYATVMIDGKEYDFDACPMAETGWIDEWEYVL